MNVIGLKGQRQFSIGVSATDQDGDKLVLGCKGGDKFTDNGNGTGTFDWLAPIVRVQTVYRFSCTASDGQLTATATITVTVLP